MQLAWPAISHYGLSFLTSATWDPVRKEFGALSFIYGTVVSSFLALLIATPLAVAIALWLSELAPRGARGVIGSLVEMLAGDPERCAGPLGDSRARPFPGAPSRAGAARAPSGSCRSSGRRRRSGNTA